MIALKTFNNATTTGACCVIGKWASQVLHPECWRNENHFSSLYLSDGANIKHFVVKYVNEKWYDSLMLEIPNQ